MAKIEETKVIWSSISGVMDFLKDPKLGLDRQQLDAALSKLPEDERTALTSSHLAWDRVPLVAVNRLVAEVARLRGEPGEVLAKRIGRYCAENSPLLKMFAMLMTPASTIKMATQAWKKIYDCGAIKAEAIGETAARMTVEDFPSEPIGCARVGGWFEVIAEAAGARNAEVTHSKCISRHDRECIWDLKWEKS